MANNYPFSWICSADHYFLDSQGVYKYDHSKIRAAHKSCFEIFCRGLELRMPVIAIDNTNIVVKNFKRYMEYAERYKYDIEIVRILCDPEIAFKRNVHNVPKETVFRMHKQLIDQPLLKNEKIIKL